MEERSKSSITLSILFFLWFTGEAALAVFFRKTITLGKFMGNVSYLEPPSHIVVGVGFFLIGLFPVVPLFLSEKTGAIAGQALFGIGFLLFTVGYFM